MDDLDTFLSSLDVTVAKATAKPRLEEEKKKLQQKLKHGQSTAGRIALGHEISEINRALEAILWRPVAIVGLFQEQTCMTCGGIHQMFLQFMSKQMTTTGAKCLRYVRTDRDVAALPRETVMHKTRTTICSDCAGDFDFDLGKAMTKLAEISEPFAIAVGYEQVVEELEG